MINQIAFPPVFENLTLVRLTKPHGTIIPVDGHDTADLLPEIFGDEDRQEEFENQYEFGVLYSYGFDRDYPVALVVYVFGLEFIIKETANHSLLPDPLK